MVFQLNHLTWTSVRRNSLHTDIYGIYWATMQRDFIVHFRLLSIHIAEISIAKLSRRSLSFSRLPMRFNMNLIYACDYLLT